MIVETPLGSNPSSPVPARSPVPDLQSDSLPAILPRSPPCWAKQAQRDLDQVEAELRRLQEHHATETDSVKRGVERAILGARREERRLLERVEQDHRDTQQRLEQIQRENTAAARVSQSLLEQRLNKLALLQRQIQGVDPQSGTDESRSIQNQLLKDIAEFLQPWEISVSIKRVNFKPSSQPYAVTFGDIRIQDQNLCLNSGGCGPGVGQLCALHSQEIQCDETTQQGSVDEKKNMGWTSPTGRVVKKISVSNWCDVESEEEQTLSAQKVSSWAPKFEHSGWESSQDDETELASLETPGEDVFLAVPTLQRHKVPDSREHTYRMDSGGKRYSPRNQRKQMPITSRRNLSPSPERRQGHARLRHSQSLDRQRGDKGRMNQDSSGKYYKFSNVGITSPRITAREPVASQSCLDLTSRGRPHSCLSQSSDEHSLATLADSGRAPSPADSLDSSYTFIVSPPHDYNMNRASLSYNCRLSKSAVDLTHRTRPLINSGANEYAERWRGKCSNFNTMASSVPSPSLRGQMVSDRRQATSFPVHQGHNNLLQQQKKATALKQPRVARSLSMSFIDGSLQEPKRCRGEGGQSVLMEMEEEGDPSMSPSGVPLIRQFGKQGSGRTDLTLPSGIHCTPQGQLFIVDCGNARVQVTDLRGNVLQQVTSSTSDGSSRRCRNYFDISVNSKGLIALSCAAERALLVFNRHGRLLQTFGGSGLGAAKDELEAPRGVTVTRQDEFLVADIRKGTLVALKLDAKTGCRLERTVVTGFNRPYLVSACLSSGMIAVSERGSETGRVPCIKVLEPGWNTIRVLGVCSGMGPVLVCPWGICIDADGNVLVADWGETHRIVLYPAQGMGWPLVSQDLSSPRGLTLLPQGHLAVSDSMNHCVKIYQYKAGTLD